MTVDDIAAASSLHDDPSGTNRVSKRVMSGRLVATRLTHSLPFSLTPSTRSSLKQPNIFTITHSLNHPPTRRRPACLLFRRDNRPDVRPCFGPCGGAHLLSRVVERWDRRTPACRSQCCWSTEFTVLSPLHALTGSSTLTSRTGRRAECWW